MINLLPLNEKLKVRSEYRTRLYTVAGFLLLVLIISITIPLAISYFALSYNVRFVNNITDNMSKSEGFKKTDAINKVIKDSGRKMTLLNDPMGISARQKIMDSIFSIFKIARELSSSKNGLVKVTQIIYDQPTKKGPVSVLSSVASTGGSKETGTHKMSVRGFASDREIFLSFLKDLETDANFINIDSPVSNLVNSSNIDFVLTITLKDKAI